MIYGLSFRLSHLPHQCLFAWQVVLCGREIPFIYEEYTHIYVYFFLDYLKCYFIIFAVNAKISLLCRLTTTTTRAQHCNQATNYADTLVSK